MTLQIGLVGTDGIVLASDRQIAISEVVASRVLGRQSSSLPPKWHAAGPEEMPRRMPGDFSRRLFGRT